MKCHVLIPIYKESLSTDEEFNVRYSLANLANQNVNISWLCPQGITEKYYSSAFPEIGWSYQSKRHFKSVSSYSRLLLSTEFYENYYDYSFILILQTDAIILRSSLDYWISQPYDYIGAPWPDGWELSLPIRTASGIEHISCRAFVGNGGLSLRSPKKMVALLNAFPEARNAWIEIGNPEDLLISMLATLYPDICIPSIGVASRFSLELKKDFFDRLHNHAPPFGLHGPATIFNHFQQSNKA